MANPCGFGVFSALSCYLADGGRHAVSSSYTERRWRPCSAVLERGFPRGSVYAERTCVGDSGAVVAWMTWKTPSQTSPYVADILERSFQHSRCSVRVMQGWHGRKRCVSNAQTYDCSRVFVSAPKNPRHAQSTTSSTSPYPFSPRCLSNRPFTAPMNSSSLAATSSFVGSTRFSTGIALPTTVCTFA